MLPFFVYLFEDYEQCHYSDANKFVFALSLHYICHNRVR